MALRNEPLLASLAVASAPVAFRVRVWEVMSRGRVPRGGCPPPEGVDVACPLPSVFIGTVDHIVDEMRGRRERYGISYYVFFDQLMKTVAPLVIRLAGE